MCHCAMRAVQRSQQQHIYTWGQLGQFAFFGPNFLRHDTLPVPSNECSQGVKF
jgi:hypothetical protein